MLKVAQQHTAVLIFANSATQELEQKTFVKKPELFEALTQETLLKVKKTGLPYFHFSEKEQSGNSFGERFVNAIKEVYEKGYDNIIAIGNDSPQLKTAHIYKAYRQLQLGKTVLGPSFDGGFYLLGLHRSNFNAPLFERLPWQRFGLLDRISQIFKTSDSPIFRLPVFQDIDAAKDVIVLLNFTKKLTSKIQTVLNNLFFNCSVFVIDKEQLYRYNYSFSFYNKGSPIATA